MGTDSRLQSLFPRDKLPKLPYTVSYYILVAQHFFLLLSVSVESFDTVQCKTLDQKAMSVNQSLKFL
ncbi:hypothetical protein XELAEV_18017505mg [Xenopus laevis]|uniref:Uncharacterized protein n=1 Tax=Xenopus laevis TaxID=8355 RepID=A0A974DBI2_XENLA|nr:hypothetical protein XELAEV_18017505mg [Xenopus laevis]